MQTNDQLQSSTADREIVITRLINAPRELVYEAWTTPAHIASWWGPDGFTTTVHSMDVREGGIFRLTMHGHGRDFENRLIFTHVEKPERLEYRHTGDVDMEKATHHSIVTFEDRGSKTFLTMRLIFDTAAERERVAAEYKAVEGGTQTISKLEGYLAETGNANDLIITRQLKAPRELVFKAWTEPERLAQWWGPKGMSIKIAGHDLKPGGVFHYCMASPDGKEMWGKFIYREIAAPERLGFINSFADEKGNTVVCPFFPVWPLEIWNLLTLTEQDGITTLVLRGRPVNATDEENKAFHAMRPGMEQGFAGTFAQLDEYLTSTIQ